MGNESLSFAVTRRSGGWCSRLSEIRPLSSFQHCIRVERCEEMHDSSDASSPACLVTGTESGSAVSVKVLVKEYVVAPVRIGLEFFCPAINGAPAMSVF